MAGLQAFIMAARPLAKFKSASLKVFFDICTKLRNNKLKRKEKTI
jgi:hypothetical protein